MKSLTVSPPVAVLVARLLLGGLGVAAMGCAALTNPVANGVPAKLLPPELLATSRADLRPLPLSLLRQPPPAVYQLAAGDMLGIYIEGVLGSADVPPPVNITDASRTPAIGYPTPVRQDGTINLPLIGSLAVDGLTVEEAERKLIEAYTAGSSDDPAKPNAGLLREDSQILLTLLRPRHVEVVVIREDSPQRQAALREQSFQGGQAPQSTVLRSGLGASTVLELPAYENDVLHALASTGGLPGLDSANIVVVQRGTPHRVDAANDGAAADEPGRSVTIPLLVRPDQPVAVSSQDIVLQNGDVVFVPARRPEYFYTGGLLPTNELRLPAHYDLRVVEAVLEARGPLVNGGLNPNVFTGEIISPGLGNPSPKLLSVLRKSPAGGQILIRVDLDEAIRDPRENILVQADDVLILQETPDQGLARYASQILRVDLAGRWLNRRDAQGTASVAAP